MSTQSKHNAGGHELSNAADREAAADALSQYWRVRSAAKRMSFVLRRSGDLCWLLDDASNTVFAGNMDELDEWFRDKRKRTHCKKGHQLTPDNTRRYGRHNQCLACYQAGAADRNRVQKARNRAKRLNLTVVRRGPRLSLLSDGTQILEGDIAEVEAYIAQRYVPRHGPVQWQAPEGWTWWIDLFVTEQRALKRSPGTIRTRERHLSSFSRRRPHLTSALDVQRSDLVDYLGEYSDVWSANMLHSVRTTFRVFFNMLVAAGYRDDNPARNIGAVSIPRSMPRPCPDDVVRHAYAAIEDDRVRLAIRLLVETGMRRGEVVGLRRDDVIGGPSAYRLHITGKGGHQRLVPISDDLADVLLSLPTDYVVESFYGGGITADRLGKLVAKALPGQRWTAHTLRHRFGTIAYQTTKDIRVVQELLGHASPTTTAIYTQVSDDAMRRAAAAAASIE